MNYNKNKKYFIGKFPEPTQKEKLKNKKKKLKFFLYETGIGILIICFVLILPGAIGYFYSRYLSLEGGEVVLFFSVLIGCFVVSWLIGKLGR